MPFTSLKLHPNLVKGIGKTGIAAFDAIVVAAAEAVPVAEELEALGPDTVTAASSPPRKPPRS